MLRVKAPLDNSVLLQRLQADRKRRRCNTFQRIMEILKPPGAVHQQVAHDQRRPARADDIKGEEG